MPLPTSLPAAVRTILENTRNRDFAHCGIVQAVETECEAEPNVSVGFLLDTLHALAEAADYLADHVARVAGIAAPAATPAAVEKIKHLVDEFTAARRRGDHGGWADVEAEDLRTLRRIVEGLVRFKFAPDASGCRPIETTFVNRHETNSLAAMPVPYMAFQLRDDSVPEVVDQAVFEVCLFNLQVALGDVDKFMKMRPDLGAIVLARLRGPLHHQVPPGGSNVASAGETVRQG